MDRTAAGFRADVEGLRAVAVVLVVLDHLLAWPAGGFIGVDVFFVISGFLITGLLASERERTGRISFRAFYARRARRILPASIVVLVATQLVARAVQLTSQAHQTGIDVLWAAAFAANIHFAQVSTDYFQSGQAHSPVQHYWSLAVEEQFYLLWPMLIVAVLALAGRLGGRHLSRPILAVALGTGVLASFGYSLQQTRSDPTAAYFSTAGRAWELGIGALVALAVPLLRRLPWRVRAAASVAGLAAVVTCAFVLDGTTPFPGPGAAAPVLAAAVVIAAGVGGVPWTAWPLTNPVSRYLGRVSYSLYLWHWPVLILLPELMPSDGPGFDLVALAAMAALTIASYHYVEVPLRRLRWSSLRERLRLRRTRVAFAWPRAAFARPGLAAVACAAIAVGGWTVQPAVRIAAVTPEVQVPVAGAIAADPGLAGEIRAALQATKWPHLQPSLGNAHDDRAPEWNACSRVDPADPHQCAFAPDGGRQTGSAVVLGDSVAISWLPGLRAALAPNGYALRGLTLMQCGVGDVSMREANRGLDQSFVKACNAHRHKAIATIARLAPDLVILSSSETSLTRLDDGSTGAAAETEWHRGMTRTLRAIRAAAPAARIVVLSPPPAAGNVSLCATAVSGPPPCVTSIHRGWLRQSRAERAAATAAGARYVDVHLLFCTAQGLCPPFIDGRVVRCDAIHLTKTFVPEVVPYLRRALLTS